MTDSIGMFNLDGVVVPAASAAVVVVATR